jgi:MFS family permease
VWGVAVALYFVAVFHRMGLGVAALEAERRYHVAAGALSVFTAVQLGVYLAMQVPVGLAADRIGPRRSLAAGMAAIAAGEAVFALSSSLAVGVAGRALVGLGDACVFINVLRVAHSWFPPRRAAVLTAVTSLIGAVGQLISTFPLHVALDRAGWTATFAGAAALSALLAGAALGLVRDAPRGSSAVAPRHAHDRIASTLRAAWAQPATRLGFWAHFGLMAPFVTMTALWGYPWLVEAQGIPGGTAAGWLAVAVAASVASAPVVGQVGARGPRAQARAAVAVAIALVTVWTLVLAWPGAQPPHALVLIALAVSGAGAATAVTGFMLAREGNPAHVAGSASGLVNCGGFTAGAAAVLAAGLLLGHGARTPTAFQHALAPMLALSVLGLAQLVRLARPAAR